jgi:hypothetical protein
LHAGQNIVLEGKYKEYQMVSKKINQKIIKELEKLVREKDFKLTPEEGLSFRRMQLAEENSKLSGFYLGPKFKRNY